jgi:exopolysaccharide biosynthesis polyprenyl glycosylphosphotransferase
MKRIALLIADLVFLYGSLFLTLFIRYPNEFWQQLALHIFPFSLIFIFWIVVFFIHNLYDTTVLRNTFSFYALLFRAILLAAAISIVFFYLIPIFSITPRANLFLFILIFTGYELANRAFFNRVIERRFHKRTMIVGINPISLELAQFLKSHPQLGYELRYFVDVASAPSGETPPNIPVIHGIKNLKEIIRESKIATVIISPEAYQIQEIIDVFYRSLGHQVTFYNLATIYEKLTGRVPLGAINQIWFLENITEAGKRAYEIIKRGIDLILACVLGAISLFLFPFIALAIKLDSLGPLFYRQRRVGQLGKSFMMTKFRTMQQHAERETGAVWSQENDPRITRVGRFLRKTRLDELPQLWNILKGEMSFIGPRAERPEFHERLAKEIPFYEERYIIKPGATGWAQLQKSYYSSVTETAEKLQFDLYYIKNRSLTLDVGIFLRTFNTILRGGGR